MAATLVTRDATGQDAAGPATSRMETTRQEATSRGEEALLAGLNDQLHAMSQPVMVLLCSLEYAAGLESVAEMKLAIGFGAESCERLRATVRAMQLQVKQGMDRGRMECGDSSLRSE